MPRIKPCLPPLRPCAPAPRAAAALLLALLVDAGHAQNRPTPVQPGQRFDSTFLNLRAPRSKDWIVLAAADGQVVFAKAGDVPDETYAAQVSTFELAPAASPAAFVAAVKAGIVADTPAPRYSVKQDRYDYTDKRGYACVHYRADTLDHQGQDGKLAPLARAPLTIQISALYCRHPRNPKLGFLASFSHRGHNPVDIEAQAQSFIDDVQVPPAPAPAAASAASR
jgi:hypothetical protein